MDNSKKTITRLLSAGEASHVFNRFEEVHCFSRTEEEPKEKCPGWDWNLSHVETIEGEEREVRGGCRYKDSFKLCRCMKLAADGDYVLEIRPKNEDDLAKEREQERVLLSEALRKIKAQRAVLEEQILGIESKIRETSRI